MTYTAAIDVEEGAPCSCGGCDWAGPMEELVDSQSEANFWDPSTQLRVVKKTRKPPPYPSREAA